MTQYQFIEIQQSQFWAMECLKPVSEWKLVSMHLPHAY